MGFRNNLGGETPPKKKKLLPEGWRDFKIMACKQAVSKSGNEMFVFHVVDKETGYDEDVYAVSVEGKAWFLKRILEACDAPHNADGVFDWDISNVINKEVQGLVEHEPNEYINRSGETVKEIQHRIVDFDICRWEK